MFDRVASQLIQPVVSQLASVAVRAGISANQLTLTGFVIGMLAAFLIATGDHLLGLAGIFASRLFDALDGAVARQTAPTDAGGFLDRRNAST